MDTEYLKKVQAYIPKNMFDELRKRAHVHSMTITSLVKLYLEDGIKNSEVTITRRKAS